MSNVKGMGARRLAQAILPCIKSEIPDIQLVVPFPSDLGELFPRNAVTYFKRYLPNSISRVLESIFPKRYNIPIINFTDVPLRTNDFQLLFLQNPHVFDDSMGADTFKSKFYRFLIRLNLRFVDVVVVQTGHMKKRFLDSYSFPSSKVVVIKQPSPLSSLRNFSPTTLSLRDVFGLRFFYPASTYPHKNHKVLSNIPSQFFDRGNVITLTCSSVELDYLSEDYFEFLGALSLQDTHSCYLKSDVLLFPSLDESFGLPIVEAMQMGLPIVIPDLPYARSLCGDSAFYFEPQSIESFLAALESVAEFVQGGMKLDYSNELADVPDSWSEVAALLIQLCDIHATFSNAGSAK